MKKRLLSAASLLAIFQATAAYACSCLPRTPQQYFESAQAAFAGRVIDIIQPNPALYSEELEVDGIVQYSTDENLWVAVIDWNRIRQQEDVLVEDSNVVV